MPNFIKIRITLLLRPPLQYILLTLRWLNSGLPGQLPTDVGVQAGVWGRGKGSGKDWTESIHICVIVCGFSSCHVMTQSCTFRLTESVPRQETEESISLFVPLTIVSIIVQSNCVTCEWLPNRQCPFPAINIWIVLQIWLQFLCVCICGQYKYVQAVVL